MLDHGCRDHASPRCQLTLQAYQLFFQQRQGLRHPDQYPVEWPAQGLAGGDVRYRVIAHAIACQVLFQTLCSQERVGAADHRGMRRQTGRQRAETVIEHQHPALQAQPGFCNMIEQVLVSSIECLQRLILLLGLANEIKFSERTDEQGHWRENSVQSKVCQ